MELTRTFAALAVALVSGSVAFVGCGAGGGAADDKSPDAKVEREGAPDPGDEACTACMLARCYRADIAYPANASDYSAEHGTPSATETALLVCVRSECVSECLAR
jgi:hypothetical protein